MALWLQTMRQKELYSTKLRSPGDNGCPSAYIHRHPTTLSKVFLPVKTFVFLSYMATIGAKLLNRTCVTSSDMVARVLGLKSGSGSVGNPQFFLTPAYRKDTKALGYR